MPCTPLQVWGIADVSRAGYLGFREFVTAMQVSLLILGTWH